MTFRGCDYEDNDELYSSPAFNDTPAIPYLLAELDFPNGWLSLPRIGHP